jgi:hypothetical protein
MQPQPTDLTKIDDIDKLKAMAYEQIKLLNQTQNNIQMIEQRITQLENEPKPKNEKTLA